MTWTAITDARGKVAGNRINSGAADIFIDQDEVAVGV
jgi:hypothetical protein